MTNSTTGNLILWYCPFTYLYNCWTCDCRTRDEPWPQLQAPLPCATVPLCTYIVVERLTVVPGMNPDLSNRQPYLLLLPLYVPISLSNVWLSYQGWTLTSATGSLILWYCPFMYLYRCQTCDCRTRDEPWPQQQTVLSCDTVPLRTYIVVIVWLSYQGWTLTSATDSLILWYCPYT